MNFSLEWHVIKSKTDINDLLNVFGSFHDGCLKELKYISGEFVDHSLSMNPINTKRCLSVIFQRQYHDPSVIEIIFDPIIRLNLAPVSEDYTGEILGAYMDFVDGVIYWSDDENFEPSKKDEYNDCTWISSASAKWRIADEYLGEGEIYITRE